MDRIEERSYDLKGLYPERRDCPGWWSTRRANMSQVLLLWTGLRNAEAVPGGRRFRLVKGSRELEKAWGCRWQPELVAMPVGLRGPQHYVRPRCPSQFNFLMEIP